MANAGAPGERLAAAHESGSDHAELIRSLRELDQTLGRMTDTLRPLIARALCALESGGTAGISGACVVAAESEQQRSSATDMQKLLGAGIYDLNLSSRAMRAVEQLGVRTFGDLTRHSTRDFIALKKCGTITINEIAEKLRWYGIALADQVWTLAPDPLHALREGPIEYLALQEDDERFLKDTLDIHTVRALLEAPPSWFVRQMRREYRIFGHLQALGLSSEHSRG